MIYIRMAIVSQVKKIKAGHNSDKPTHPIASHILRAIEQISSIPTEAYSNLGECPRPVCNSTAEMYKISVVSP